VFAYTNVAECFTERTIEAIKALNSGVKRSIYGKLLDAHGMFIEENMLMDNLMLGGCVYSSAECFVVEQAPEQELFSFLDGFEKCLRFAQTKFEEGQAIQR
jgi:hypothetical protein